MNPASGRKSGEDLSIGIKAVDKATEEIPTKDEILDGIREGYVFVMSGGKGQPIDDVHREIAEELAREENALNADISR